MSNWTGKAIAASRSELGDFHQREEVSNPGIYLLTGTDPDSDKPALYIGGEETAANRIRGKKLIPAISFARLFNEVERMLRCRNRNV